MDQIGIRVSCPDKTVAEPIGRAAVEARLAACAHVWPIRSSYRWRGRVESGAEWSLALKSRADLFDDVADLIRNAHPYDLPAITSHPCAADEATTAWIIETTDRA